MKIIQSKKAQFFLVSLVFVLISIFYIFMYVRTADLSSVLFFERSHVLDVQNIIDAIQTRNNRFSYSDWFNVSWAHRRRIEFSATVDFGTSVYLFEINPEISLDKLPTASCFREIRLTTSASITELQSNVTTSALPCNVTRTEAFDTCGASSCVINFSYNVYYGNANAQTPSYRVTQDKTGAETQTTGREEWGPARLCAHFKSIYPKTGATIDCEALNINRLNNMTNISLYFRSPTLIFNGTIT